jgi:hypothetical protein
MDESFTSSTVHFKVDSSSGRLGAEPAKELAAGSQRAESLDFHKWGVRADILGLYHGTFEGKPASVVSFEFRFLFDDGGSGRFSEAKIVTTFERLRKADKTSTSGKTNRLENDDDEPVVKLFAPKLIDGPVSVGKRNTETSIYASVGGPDTLPIKPEIGISRSNGVEYLKDYKMQIKGKRWSSPGHETDNMAIWTLLENSKQGDGIPLDFRAAVLVQHAGRPFQGTIKISVRTKLGLKLFGWPWSTPNPLLFRPDVSFGALLGVADLDTLEDSHWRKLCDFPGVVSVSFAPCW